MRNPPAFDKFLFNYQEQLVKVVPPEWLPEPVLVATKVDKEIARHQQRIETLKYIEQDHLSCSKEEMLRAVTADAEAAIQKLMKRPRTRRGFREYGAGHYGVVYPTQNPGIVCKITTDASEAQTVANIMSWDQQPYGMVKYYAVFQFSGSSLKRRPVYILWRDEVQPLTLADDRGNWEKRMLTLLHSTKDIAHQARLWIQTAMKREWKRSGSFKQVYTDLMWARDNEPDWSDDMNMLLERGLVHGWTRGLGRLPFRSRMSHVLSALRTGWRDLMSWSYGFHPGHALFTCLENDMLLADVHANNVMKAMDGNWDVSDPGHMIELSSRYRHVKIPTL